MNLKTSAERRSEDNQRLSRRLELVRDFRVPKEKSNRRFRIGLADNVFTKSTRRSDVSPSGEELPISAPTSNEHPGFTRTDLAVGLAAIAGLALGFLIGKRRK